MSTVTDHLVMTNDKKEPNLSQPCVKYQGKQKMTDKDID